MALPRKIKIVLFGLVVFVALVALATCLSWSHLERYAAGVHQRSVTRSLAEWDTEYASVTNDASAIAAAEMVGYISHYYVPGPGYRGPADVEAALERQRADTVQHLVDALQHYTGLDYGTNTQQWAKWAETHKNSERDGAANRSQPVRPDTNRTSAAAGSGR
jgi:hypothetical protein